MTNGPKLAETIPSDNDVRFRDFITQQTGSSFSFRPVSVTLVYNLLKKLSTFKATGMDKISVKLLKTTAPAIAPSLTEIINILTDSEWKNARVIASFKKGQQTILENYRPISILAVVSKFMSEFCMTKFMDISIKRIFFQNNNLALDLAILLLLHC